MSWVLYDLANTIFSMGVVSLYFSLYVRDEVGAERADSLYGLITAISMGAIFFVSPLIGAMTDRAARRMPFLVWSTIICCVCTALLARGSFALSAVLFIVGNAAYQAGLQFYDALLPEVSTENNRGRISGIGVGVGYVGSYLAVGLGFLVSPEDNPALLFTTIALLFLLFAIPSFLYVRERGNPRPRPVFQWGAIKASMRETWLTLRSSTQYPGLRRFLIGRVFYTDAINTVISFMALYTVNVAMATGLSEAEGKVQSRIILFTAVTFAIIGGFVWGRLVDALGPKKTLDMVLGLWVLTFVLAVAIGLFGLGLAWLYVVVVLAGIALGGIWSADRPYMLRLTPPDRIGEFYGLYGMVGRFSAVLGPLIWAATMHLAVERSGLPPLVGQAMAIATLLGMIVVSYVILRPVSDARTSRSIASGVSAGP